VAHSALQHKKFNSIGTIKTNDFEYADGKVQGELTTDGQAEVFGETWGVNLKFVAPLGEIPKEFQVAEAKKPRPSRRRTNSKPRTSPSRKMRPTSSTRSLLSMLSSRARRT
jgi:hypothetical protein